MSEQVGIGVYLAAEYLAGAIFNGFATLLYRQRGMTLPQVSMLVGIMPLVAILGQPFWGCMADRSRVKNRVHRLLLLGSAGAILALGAAQGFWWLAGAVALLAFFSTAVLPLTETIALEHLATQGRPFGPLRIWGTVASGLGTLAAAFLLRSEHMAGAFAWLVAGLYGVCFGASFRLPRVAGHCVKGKKASWRSLLKDSKLVWMLGLGAVLQLTQGWYFTYYALYLTQELGASRELLGVAMLVAILSEIPFLLVADRLLKRLGAARLMVLASASMALHWLLLGLLEGLVAAIATQLLHGLGFVVLGFCLIKYLQETLPKEMKATGQMFASLVTYGLARTLAGLLGSGLAGLWDSASPIFLTGAGLAGAAVVGMGLRLWKMGGEAGKQAPVANE